MNQYGKITLKTARQSGFSIMEVLIGIGIFAIGMLALSSLQGALTRAAAEAKVRTEAVNIAEEIIEVQKGFSRVLATTGVFDFSDIKSSASPLAVTRNNVTYNVSQTVANYYFHPDSDSFTTTSNGAFAPNYKAVTVTVAWGDDREFVIQEGVDTGSTGVTTDANIGGGSVQVSSIIASVSVATVGKVAEESEKPLIAPPVAYTPGLNPEIVALDLNGSKFKEALTPEPRVTHRDELVDTRFEVVTYSQSNGFNFLRREEFAAVNCECTYKGKPGNAADGGRRPTLWLGDEYLEPEFVDKPYGVSANTQQSPLCDTCCRDHHDGGTGSKDSAYGDGGAILYNPYRASDDYYPNNSALKGDHKHYKKDRQGNLSLAGVDDTYVEACRLVRKDGFFKVAQDFNLENLNVFPYDFLVGTADVAAYSDWLIPEISTFASSVVTNGYGNSLPFSAPNLSNPSRTAYPTTAVGANDLTLDWTELPTALGADFQQLRSRGVYVDYMIKDLRDTIDCLNQSGDVDSCQYGDVKLDKISVDPVDGVNILEIIPFFEVQLTYLNNWSEELGKKAVEVTSEPVETGNTHSRGEVSKATGGSGFETVTATAPQGVLGFTDTDPIDGSYTQISNTIDVHLDNTGTPINSGKIVSGTISSGVTGVQARSVEVLGINALCNFVGVDFTCLVPAGGGAILKVSNYHKSNDKDIVACSDDPSTLPPTQGTDTASNPWTKFDLDGALDKDTHIYQISIEPESCDNFGGIGG